ncbi:TetR/AcrR family transcriptional regulator [uncultured Roseobacter sp.]|uniref:TetR/AcrR family transcriptional regulator n=1 Tax=uncultured Roseobacter sp. TaxID=114847 RepID=UPI0026138FBD|nr:TetR/AcrR family transcriptional regulator [uncultured Roseobacter sp.]
MNNTKKAGRPKKFDRDEALLKAVEVFWKQGYEGASMKLLTDSMGINSPSLYAEFGDKHRLYLEAIDRYANDDGCAPLVALETEPDIELAVRAFFEAAIDYSTHHASGARGCFLASCVATSAGHVDGTAEMLRAAIEATDTRITARFDVEKARGALPSDFPSSDQAKLLFDLRQGLVFRARAGFSRGQLLADIDKGVAAVMNPAVKSD